MSASVATMKGTGTGPVGEPAGKQVGVAHVGCVSALSAEGAWVEWLGDVAEVTIGRGDARAKRRGGHLELRVPDPMVSRLHARIVRTEAGYSLVDEGSTNGVLVGGRRVVRAQPLRPGDIFETGRTFWRFVEVLPKHGARLLAESHARIGPVRTIHPPLVEELHAAEAFVRGTQPLIVLGETGTGKEVLARQAHKASGRRGEFRAVNCAAIPPTLIESELFGHRKGAFTNATQDRPGIAEAAEGGTLFLDEIGDLALDAQAKLLRLLQDGEFARVGDTKVRHVDVRVIAATHRDLPELVRDSGFREDLYGRLTGMTLRLPPLRERLEDMGTLVAHFLAKGGDAPPRVDVELMRVLFRHRWPFNVRELERVVATALALADGASKLRVEHVAGILAETKRAGKASARAALSAKPDDTELRSLLEPLMAEHGGNVSAVARELGKARTQVQRWLRRLKIPI